MRYTALTILLSYTVCVVGWKNKKNKKEGTQKLLRNRKRERETLGPEEARREGLIERVDRVLLRRTAPTRESKTRGLRREAEIKPALVHGGESKTKRYWTENGKRLTATTLFIWVFWILKFFFGWWVCLFRGFCFGLCPDSFSYEKTLKIMITWKHEVKAWIFTWNC